MSNHHYRQWSALFLLLLFSTLCLGCAERIRQYAVNQCQGYGFAYGTTAFARCVQLEEMRWHADVQNALTGLQHSLQQMQPPPPPRPVHCVTTYYGSQAITSCQ